MKQIFFASLSCLFLKIHAANCSSPLFCPERMDPMDKARMKMEDLERENRNLIKKVARLQEGQDQLASRLSLIEELLRSHPDFSCPTTPFNQTPRQAGYSSPIVSPRRNVFKPLPSSLLAHPTSTRSLNHSLHNTGSSASDVLPEIFFTQQILTPR